MSYGGNRFSLAVVVFFKSLDVRFKFQVKGMTHVLGEQSLPTHCGELRPINCHPSNVNVINCIAIKQGAGSSCGCR